MKQQIIAGEDWTFEKLEWICKEIEKINDEEFQFDIFPPILEVITYEQMLDKYTRGGLPIGYDHWTYGEAFLRDFGLYKANYKSLAFEIVQNANPCRAYMLENNSLLMQALTYAHAAIGHNTVYKTNYLFKEFTDPAGIIDYMTFANNYIKECEEKYGEKEVETLLDCAHAIRYFSFDKFKRTKELTEEQKNKKLEDRLKYEETHLNELWKLDKSKVKEEDRFKFPKTPESNLLYFIEKNAPKLETWQREVLRIVRKVSEYFFPSFQTGGPLHEAMATYVHYTFMNRLYEKGLMDDGSYTEFLHMHSMVITQPDDTNHMNPYALGFAILKDVERVSHKPTEEDITWFKNQDWVGNKDHIKNIKFAVANFNNSSFILQYLTPKVIRDFRLYSVLDDATKKDYLVEGIHNEDGYKIIRKNLANQYDIDHMFPHIEIVNVDIWGDRTMTLQHNVVDGRPLDGTSEEQIAKGESKAGETCVFINHLWGYPVVLNSVDLNNQDAKNSPYGPYIVEQITVGVDQEEEGEDFLSKL